MQNVMRSLMVASSMAVLLFSSVTEAQPQPVSPSWTYISQTSSPITISWINGGKTGTSQVAYSPVAEGIWSYDGNLGSQNSAVIMQDMQNQFGLSSTALSPVVLCGNAASCISGGNGTSTAATWSTGKNFDYLAVHYGQGELFFHFAKPVDTFSIQGLHNGLSNLYAYSSTTSAVAEPAPLAMLMVGLIGLVWRQRRNKL